MTGLGYLAPAVGGAGVGRASGTEHGGADRQDTEEQAGTLRADRLVAGQRLQASRDLARDLEVSRGVVVEAHEQLTAEGFVVGRQGSGTRVAGFAAATADPCPAPSVAAGTYRYDLRPGPDLASFPRARWHAAPGKRQLGQHH